MTASAVLTVGSTLTCANGGNVTLAGTAKLRVGGQSVLTVADVQSRPVQGCKAPSSATSKPCTTILTATDVPAKLAVAGTAVARATLAATTDGLPPPPPPGQPLADVDAGQTVLLSGTKGSQ